MAKHLAGMLILEDILHGQRLTSLLAMRTTTEDTEMTRAAPEESEVARPNLEKTPNVTIQCKNATSKVGEALLLREEIGTPIHTRAVETAGTGETDRGVIDRI